MKTGIVRPGRAQAPVSQPDQWHIDSHKLMYHVERVSQWLRGETIYPIYLEMGLYGGCNHRCVFCAFDYLNYIPDVMDVGLAKRFIREAGQRGVKSILFAAEGEPLLYPHFEEVVSFTKAEGIDVATATNGVLLDKQMAESILPHSTWIRISLDAGKASTYAAVHRAPAADFHKVISNIESAVRVKKKNGLSCVIGVQFLILSKNYREAPALARLLRSLGVDYFSLKPFCQHPLSMSRPAWNIDPRMSESIRRRTMRQQSRSFKVVYRKHALECLAEGKTYDRCLGLPFAAHVTPSGDIYPCNLFLGKKDFIIGNISRQSFKKIWEGRKRRSVMKRIAGRGVAGCRSACRLDPINRYLWELKHPGSHVNFI